jgi:hypothetical protein
LIGSFSLFWLLRLLELTLLDDFYEGFYLFKAIIFAGLLLLFFAIFCRFIPWSDGLDYSGGLEALPPMSSLWICCRIEDGWTIISCFFSSSSYALLLSVRSL